MSGRLETPQPDRAASDSGRAHPHPEMPITPQLEPFLRSTETLSPLRRQQLQLAMREVEECSRVLRKANLNIVGEVLRGQGTFYEMNHYPDGDVFDRDSGGQYYYHAHRGSVEHGHFHIFARPPALAQSARALDPAADVSDGICHLIAISMDAWGTPQGFFATNRWVTGESGFCAQDAIRALARFEIDHAWPSWPLNRWLSAMVRLYAPWIEALLEHRDAVLAAHAETIGWARALEDRNLEVTGAIALPTAELRRQLA